MTWAETLSIVASALSIALAVFAIWQSDNARRDTQRNSTDIGKALEEIRGQSAGTLDQVAKTEQDIRGYLVKTQEGLLEMQKDLVGAFTKRMEAEIPDKPDPGQAAAFAMLQNPELMKMIMPFLTSGIQQGMLGAAGSPSEASAAQ